MSRTIKATYDADTTAGDDETKDFLIAADDGDGNPVVLDKGQLSDAVATDGVVGDIVERVTALETGTAPIPTGTTVAASVAPNRLTVSISISGYTGVGGAVTVNTTAVPTATTWTGATPTSYQTPSADWGVTETLRFWEVDSLGNWNEIKTETGVSGIEVDYTDTLGPTGLSITNSGVNVTIGAATDVGVGIDTTGYAIYIDPPAVIGLTQPYLSGLSAGTHIIDRPPGTYNVVYTAQDLNGNVTVSDSVSVTVPVLSAGSVGWTNTSETVTEGGGAQNIQLTRTGTTGELALSCAVKVSTVADTAVATTNYTAISSQTVNFATTVETVNVSLTIIDDSSTTNNQLFLVIDYGSGDTGANEVTVNENESVRILITGSGSTINEGFQQSGVSPYMLCWESDFVYTARNSTEAGQTSDAWAPGTVNSRASEGTLTKGDSSANNYGSTTEIGVTAPVIDYKIALDSGAVSANTTNLWDIYSRTIELSPTDHQPAHPTILRPIETIGANDTGTGGAGFQLVTLYDNHGLTTTSSATNNGEPLIIEGTGGALDGEHAITSASGKIFDIANTGVTYTATDRASAAVAYGEEAMMAFSCGLHATANSRFGWNGQDTSGNYLETYIDSADTWVFRVVMQDNGFHHDRWAIIPRISGYDADESLLNVTDAGLRGLSFDDDMGPVSSTYEAGAGGTTENNENNNPILFLPLPTATVAVSISPSDGSLTAAPTTVVRLSVPGYTELYLNYFYLQSPSGATVNSTLTYSPTGDYAELRQQPLAVGSTYTVQFSGRARKSDGMLEQLTLATAPWTFTVADTSGTTYQQNFDSYFNLTAGMSVALTPEDAATLFESPYIPTSIAADGFNNGKVWLTHDSAVTNSGHEGVLECIQEAFTTGTTAQWDFLNKSGLDVDELYIAFDFALDTNYICPRGIHVAAAWDQNFRANAPAGETIGAQFQLSGNNPSVLGGSPIVQVDNCPGIYYHGLLRQQAYLFASDSPDYNSVSQAWGLDPSRNYFSMNPGQFYRIKIHLKINTSLSPADGICKMWIDDVLVVSKTNMAWIDPAASSLNWDRWAIVNWVNWDAVQRQSYYFDRFVIDESEVF